MEFKFNENKDILFYGNSVETADAYILFPKNENGSHVLRKVFVDPKLRGEGIAGKMMAYLVEYIETENIRYTVTCSYAKSWLSKVR